MIYIEGKACWILIDLDASCALGALAGQKVTSSAFFPPEMARRELDKLKDKPKSEPETVVASKQFEMWYIGLLLLQLCTVEAPTLWMSTQGDNMLEPEDMQSPECSVDLSRCDDGQAIDLEIEQVSFKTQGRHSPVRAVHAWLSLPRELPLLSCSCRVGVTLCCRQVE